ncbi:MAG: secondary thiamine-phosphate synthase enzyme YjbQ [Chitinispirillaceae bacterium]
MVFSEEVSISTSRRSCWVDVTSQVQGVVMDSGIKQGICTVSSLHTTGGITLNENADPDVERDFFYKLDRLVDRDPNFRHAEGNSDSHLKTSMVGLSALVPIRSGKLVLGTWQSMYFCEFDGPRSRRVTVTVMGENG